VSHNCGGTIGLARSTIYHGLSRHSPQRVGCARTHSQGGRWVKEEGIAGYNPFD
jgi:hypothetical protein